MALPLFGEIEKLINEHGSALILKERIELLKEPYAVIEKRLEASELEKLAAFEQKQALELDSYRLKDRVAELEAQIAERHGRRRDSAQESLLSTLAQLKNHISTDEAAGLCGLSYPITLFHLEELEAWFGARPPRDRRTGSPLEFDPKR